MSALSKPVDETKMDAATLCLANMTMSVEPPEGVSDAQPEDQAAEKSPSDSGVDVSIEKKKKKKKKGKSKGKRNQPTGFEQNYAEAPVTPAEFEREANDLYHPSRSFNERIETCIQRYRARRKMNSEISDYFDHYLSLGGVSTKSKMFSGGVDFGKDCELDAEQIATIRATDYVDGDKDNTGRDSSWVVDWEGIAKGFFSDYAPEKWDLHRTGVITSLTNVVDNFLRYVLHHNVCPEYTEQVEDARKVCLAAKVELPLTIQASQLFPGQFGKACSVLFGGRYGNIHRENFEHAVPFVSSTSMNKETAVKILKVAVSILGNEEQNKLAADLGSATLKIRENIPLEIIGIEDPTKETYEYYDQLDQSLERVGKLTCCDWDAPFEAPQDLTDEELAAPKPKTVSKTYEFWVDEELLQCCKVGMKLNASIGILNDGTLHFIDYVNVFHCSFFTYLLNRQLENWVTPRPWNKNSGGETEEEDQGDDEEDDETVVGYEE